MRTPILFVSLMTTLAACQTVPEPYQTAPEPYVASSIIKNPIERVRAAYQVDRLKAAKTVRLEEELRQEYPDHDYSSDFHDTSFVRRHFILDIENQRGTSEYLTEITNTFYHGRRVLQDGESKFIIYGSDVYQNEGERSFFSEYGRQIRGSDAMLALWLVNSAETARIEDDEVWMGKAHDKITIDLPESPPLTILIQKDTGYIAKMTRILGEDTKISYTFDRHRVQDGIAIATENNVYNGREKLFYTFGHRIVLNDQNDQAAFEIEEDILPEPKRIDQSTETIDKISTVMYHAGQEEAYSTFVKTGDGLLAFGLQAGFSERLQAYRTETGDLSPLRYGVVTDHHLGELAGAAEAAKQGAILLVTADAVGRVREATDEVRNTKIETVDEPRSIGSMMLLPLSTSHASKVLVGYDSNDRILIQTGHWSKVYESAPVRADFSSFTLYKALQPYDLLPTKILSTDSHTTGDWSTFISQIEAYEQITCHRSRPICKG